jgi:hypothetical protein
MAIEMQDWHADVRRLEEAVNRSDGDGLRARWESGRYMLGLRKGKQLPHGMAAQLEAELKVSRSELTARMKFAAKFTGEQELTDAIGKYKTWFGVTQRALTAKPRRQKAGDDRQDQSQGKRLRQICKLLDNIEPAELVDDDLPILSQIGKQVAHLRTAMMALQKAA